MANLFRNLIPLDYASLDKHEVRKNGMVLMVLCLAALNCPLDSQQPRAVRVSHAPASNISIAAGH